MKAARLNPAVPPRARPTAGGGATLGGYAVMRIPGHTENELSIDPNDRTIHVSTKTWSWFQKCQAGLLAFVHEQAEAERLMQVTMVDVASYLPKADPQRKIAPPPMGITLLCRDLQRLVGDMSAADVSDPEAVKDMAVRYGKMRDTMAELRGAFLQAEGAFELVQELLIQKLGGDDE